MPVIILEQDPPSAFGLSDVLFRLGFKELNPMQEKAVEAGVLEPGNFVLSAPTASGKTLIALLRMVENLKARRGKCVYIVPLRALAAEKFDEFSTLLPQFGASVAVSTGDLDSASENLAAFDVIVVTSEKMDSLLRHKPAWIKSVSLVVADEVHLINDEGRGATLEVVLTKLAREGAAILALSGTIPNAKEMAAWLGAKFSSSEWRPTKLDKGVAVGGKLFFESDPSSSSPVDEKRPVIDLARMAMQENGNKGQAIVFVSTRRSAEAVAEELTRVTRGFLTPEELSECKLLSQKALHALTPPTTQCESLAGCLENGIAFHHAGLVDRDRKLIEDGFKKKRCVRIIVATTTLAMGIDFPASWVILRDVKRFGGSYSAFISNLEVAQMCGRAGRPRYDKRGVGVLVCGRQDAGEVWNRYFASPLENVYSKLSSEPALRMHSLSLISTNYANSFESLYSFFGDTLFAKQFGATAELEGKIERVTMELMGFDFVREKAGKLFATSLGRRVSELYLDPLSAHSFVQHIRKQAFKGGGAPAGVKAREGMPPEFSLFLEFSGAIESRPLPRVGRAEENALWEELYAKLDDLSVEKWEMDSEALEKFKNAKIANAWINEESEEKILQDFDLPPGVVHSRMRILEWLCYSMSELAYLLNASGVRLSANKLRRRIKYGVKEELLDLVRLRNIGRVRARRLFNSGIKNSGELKAAPKEKLSKLLGEKLAEKISSGGMEEKFAPRKESVGNQPT
ncbi:DEAD/DEAH box helicase [Candidatus Micrarchaeota archaeon]|nr:DEAD/DEAH box helicase [Candidatus Micrarchaeota archaeon]MBI5177410.1 DEAD/DEAH box helicase [Candidatus Micrarchaeota archaeon]